MPASSAGADSTMTMQFVHSAGSLSLRQDKGDVRKPLVETLQLVEPYKHRPVPNHILETKVFATPAENQLIKAQPAELHFRGFELGTIRQQKLELLNMSNDSQRMHIIPPQTKYFDIKYTKGPRMVPGLAVKCIVQFFPDECRYYYDCIRVHCQGEQHLIIPIYAYPILDTSDFPKIIDFPPVPIGQTRTKSFPLRCLAPVCFDFHLTYLVAHSALSVEPMNGSVPANGEVEIRVKFTPTAFKSATMKMQLHVNQFFANPLVCTVNGHSAPGLTTVEDLCSPPITAKSVRAASSQSLKEVFDLSLDNVAVSPLDRARRNRQSSSAEMPRLSARGIGSANVIPGRPVSISAIISCTAGRLSAKDMRKVMSTKEVPLTRQMKEAMFESSVHKCAADEQKNQMRWQTRLGSDQMTPEFYACVLGERQKSDEAYRVLCGEPNKDEEIVESEAERKSRRTIRYATNVVESLPEFDVYTNDVWIRRQDTLARFKAAAYKIVIQLRMERRMRLLRRLFQGDVVETSAASNLLSIDAEYSPPSQPGARPLLTLESVAGDTFPVYTDPASETAIDALGRVDVKPTVFRTVESVPYFSLKVPQAYKLLGYQRHDVQAASVGYVSPARRPLRTGAEEEFVRTVDKVSVQDASQSDPRVINIVPLIEPAAMSQSFKYHPLHIFNPIPGLQTFQNRLPYSDIDNDYNLCPVPQFISTDDNGNILKSAQKQFLDQQEVIKGVMTWKKFPSPTILTLSGAPSLATIWVPRWNDPFNSEILPHEVPRLYDRLSEDDKTTIMEYSSGETQPCDMPIVQLTPEMVKAEFDALEKEMRPDCLTQTQSQVEGQLPSSNVPADDRGPIERERREAQLEKFVRSTRNVLGQKIDERLTTINGLKKNSKHVLN